MLIELEIKDFALIKNVRVSFTRGLNVLTGETGAGKSIIIDALNAVLGGKTGPAIIRPGAERATVDGVFEPTPEICAWMKENELLDGDDSQLIVSREITKSGSRMRINGTVVNSTLMQELRQRLLTIHAQHEARTLLSPQSQLDMLDGLGDESHRKVLSLVRTLYARRKELAGQLKDLQMSEEERVNRLDFARFQLHELTEADLDDPGEDESVSADCRKLANVVELGECIARSQQIISEADSEEVPSALDLLQRALTEVERATELDNTLENICESLGTCVDTLDEVQRSLRRYHDSLDFDPETLSSLEARLAQLATIKRKYGPTLADAIARQTALENEVRTLENSQTEIDNLREQLAKTDEELLGDARKLSDKRRKLAQKLASTIQSELAELGMEKCKFEIPFSGADTSDDAKTGPTGIDRIEFQLSANPGQPLMPVAKIASGGELSRVMLVVKSIFAEADKVATVIFDEIDTGLSGKTLQSMRDKLARLAASHQILCITHQPIIASIADNHVEVSKSHAANSTSVSVQILDEKARVKALAAMASGESNQAEALRFAQALFTDSQRTRQSFHK